MNQSIHILNNEEGTVLVAAILILVLLTLLGITGIYTSNTEKSVAVNQEIYKMTFYAAEAGRTYVVANDGQDLYGRNNTTVGNQVNFPLPSPPAPPQPDIVMSSNMSFDGYVEYLGATRPPRGSGFEHPKFKAHNYKMVSRGHGPRNAQVEIEAGFYRIGF